MLSSIFGSSPSLNFGPSQGYMSSLQALGGNLGQQAAQGQGQYNQFNANDVSALNNYSAYLQANPATEQNNAALTAQAEQGSQAGATRAAANLDQNLAQRGISPDSSIGVGGLSSIAAEQAGANTGVSAEVAARNQALMNQNKATLAGLWGGAAGQAFNQNLATTGQQAGIYGNLLSAADQQALAQYQQSQQNQQGSDQLFGALGTGLSMIPGIGTGGKIAGALL